MSKTKGPSPQEWLGQTIDLKIEKLVVGGAGLGRHQGFVVFVDLVAPGELVSAQIIEVKKNLAFAKLIKVIEPSTSRVKAPCEHFGPCGGCNWQHLAYPAQLEQKQQTLHSLFGKSERLSSVKISKIVPSPHEFSYRNRIQMEFFQGQLCFRGRKSHDLIPIQDCWIAEPPLRAFLQKAPLSKLNENTRYEIYLDAETAKVEYTAVAEEEAGARFSQVNRSVNELVIASVLEQLDLSSTHRLIELYAGAGNFTFPISRRAKFSEIYSAEGSSYLVQRAKETQKNLSISPSRLKFFCSDVDSFLKSFWPNKNDTVFLDPPRSGTSNFVLKTLADSRPRHILYLSCHPATLTRDLDLLLGFAPEYKIEHVKPFDMFPQTDHLETLVSLKLTEN